MSERDVSRAATRDDQVYLGAYWAGRSETPASLARQLHGFLEALAPLGEGFGDWFLAEDVPLPGGPALVDWLVPRLDPSTSGEKPELGMSLEVLSDKGESETRLGLVVTAGIHDALPVLTNALVLSPRDTDAREVLPDHALAALLACVDAWDPDWAVVTTRRLRGAAFKALGRRRGPFPGPLTWVCDAYVDEGVLAGLPGARSGFGQGSLVDSRSLVGTRDESAVSDLARAWRDRGAFARFPQK